MASDEQLRIWTAAGAPTASFKPRGEVHRDGDWHATVHLWLLNDSGELLFQKRSDSAELYPGLWDVSAAGHVVDDESLATSLEREALEELGIDITANAAQWLFTLSTESHSGGLHERVFQHVYLMALDVADHQFKPQLAEVAAVAWHPYLQLARVLEDASGFVPRLEEYRRLLDYLQRRSGPA